MGVLEMSNSWRVSLYIVVFLTVFGSWISVCPGQQISAVFIEKALDDPAKIDYQNITLEDAFKNLHKQLGIPFEVDQTALAQLPYGKLTTLSSVQLQGMPWRDALRELLKPLALTFQPGADRIFIFGTDELMRQPRPLNLIELDSLVRLQNSNLNNSDKNLLRQIRQITNTSIFRLIEIDRHVEKAHPDSVDKSLSSYAQSAAKVLDLYSRRVISGKYKLEQPGTWYIRADMVNGQATSIDIVILPAVDLNLLKLQRRISFPFKNLPIQDILYELANLGALDINFEPGCFTLLDENLVNNFSLVMSNATIKDAFEEISGLTGLAHEVRPDGIHIVAGETLLQKAAERERQAAQSANPLACVIIAKLPETDFETMIFVREEELRQAGVLEKYRDFQKKNIAEFIRFLRIGDQTVPVIKR
ncbi:MAG: hypothetical protein GY869_31480 [Planctomycetes bacterium]|nr:hypothetical protein [Planctomycetota bacterium]